MLFTIEYIAIILHMIFRSLLLLKYIYFIIFVTAKEVYKEGTYDKVRNLKFGETPVHSYTFANIKQFQYSKFWLLLAAKSALHTKYKNANTFDVTVHINETNTTLIPIWQELDSLRKKSGEVVQFYEFDPGVESLESFSTIIPVSGCLTMRRNSYQTFGNESGVKLANVEVGKERQKGREEEEKKEEEEEKKEEEEEEEEEGEGEEEEGEEEEEEEEEGEDGEDGEEDGDEGKEKGEDEGEGEREEERKGVEESESDDEEIDTPSACSISHIEAREITLDLLFGLAFSLKLLTATLGFDFGIDGLGVSFVLSNTVTCRSGPGTLTTGNGTEWTSEIIQIQKRLRFVSFPNARYRTVAWHRAKKGWQKDLRAQTPWSKLHTLWKFPKMGLLFFNLNEMKFEKLFCESRIEHLQCQALLNRS